MNEEELKQQQKEYSNQNDYQSQNSYQSQNVYQTNDYQNQGMYQPGYEDNGYNRDLKERKSGNGFGIASLVLGLISLVLFCTCINIPLAILAIIFGIIQLVRGGNKGMAIAGTATGVVSIIALVVYWTLFMGGISRFGDFRQFPYEYEESYPNIFEDIEQYQFEDEYDFHKM